VQDYRCKVNSCVEVLFFATAACCILLSGMRKCIIKWLCLMSVVVSKVRIVKMADHMYLLCAHQHEKADVSFFMKTCCTCATWEPRLKTTQHEVI